MIPAGEAATAVDAAGASGTQDLFLVIVLGLMALPLVLVMTLLSTVLIRR
jgi:hypothetical protein